MVFRNQNWFDDDSYKAAQGYGPDKPKAFIGGYGGTALRPRSGGILSPKRVEIPVGPKLFRFGRRAAGWKGVAAGRWWLDRPALDHLLGFSSHEKVSLIMAARMLCLVPPEWSDLSLLVRARVDEPLLAWGGAANSVVLPPIDVGGPRVSARMADANDFPARRLYQLFIPGLDNPQVQPALAVEEEFPLHPVAGERGLLLVARSRIVRG